MRDRSKCLVPECKGWAKTRGLCARCYSTARGLVRTKRATWADMEGRGVIAAVKAKGERGPTARAEWLTAGNPLAKVFCEPCTVPVLAGEAGGQGDL